jgi:hypothetical protein
MLKGAPTDRAKSDATRFAWTTIAPLPCPYPMHTHNLGTFQTASSHDRQQSHQLMLVA